MKPDPTIRRLDFNGLPDERVFLELVNQHHSGKTITGDYYLKLKFIAATFTQLRQPIGTTAKKYLLAECYKLLHPIVHDAKFTYTAINYLTIIYDSIVRMLVTIYGSEEAVSRTVDLMFSHQASAYGCLKDARASCFFRMDPGYRDNALCYLTPQDVEVFRVNFIGGVANQRPYWGEPAPFGFNGENFDHAKLIARAGSTDTWVPMSSVNNPTVAIPDGKYEAVDQYAALSGYKDGVWSSVVMDRNWAIYSAPHTSFTNEQREHANDIPFIKAQGGKNFFHSSYLRRDNVDFSGAWLVENGKVTGICNHTGHYMGSEYSLYVFARALQMNGVKLADIDVFKVVVLENEEDGAGFTTGVVSFGTADKLMSSVGSAAINKAAEEEATWRETQTHDLEEELARKNEKLEFFLTAMEDIDHFLSQKDFEKIQKQRKKDAKKKKK